MKKAITGLILLFVLNAQAMKVRVDITHYKEDKYVGSALKFLDLTFKEVKEGDRRNDTLQECVERKVKENPLTSECFPSEGIGSEENKSSHLFREVIAIGDRKIVIKSWKDFLWQDGHDQQVKLKTPLAKVLIEVNGDTAADFDFNMLSFFEDKKYNQARLSLRLHKPQETFTVTIRQIEK